MTNAQLYKELCSLPDTLRRQVVDFITFLKQNRPSEEVWKRPLGLAKGKIIIKDSFDDPVSGFEELQ